MDGPGDRIDPAEIEPGDVGNGRVRAELTARGVHGVKLDALARRDAGGGRIVAIPAEMALMLVDGVVVHCRRAICHPWHRCSRSSPGCGSDR
jgi:hypothetical protein